MHAEAPARLQPVVIDHQQRTETPPGGVIVASEAEAVPALQPAVAAVEAFGGRPQHQTGMERQGSLVSGDGGRGGGFG